MSMESERQDGDKHLDAASGSSGPSIALVLAVVVAVFLVIFVLRNGDTVNIDFMVFEWETTIRWLIFISVVLGVLLDRLVGWWWRRRKRRKAK